MIDSDDTVVMRDGRLIGFVRPRANGDQFEPFTANLESLGRYNSAFAAARALINRTMPAGAHVERR